MLGSWTVLSRMVESRRYHCYSLPRWAVAQTSLTWRLICERKWRSQKGLGSSGETSERIELGMEERRGVREADSRA